MSSQQKEAPTLSPEAAAKLTDFARACKASARAVTLYPGEHPAIRLSLSRLVDAASRVTAHGPVTLGVIPDNLMLDGLASPRPDQAVRETAALFHEHMIGLLTVHSSPDPAGWLPFLQLLARPVDEVRAAGGVGRLWAATGQRHLDIQEIDYADILRDRGGKQESHWDDIISACLNLDAPLDDETLKNLLGICAHAEQFKDFVVELEQSSGTGTGSKASALLRMLKGIVDVVARTDPSRLEPLLKNVAQGFGKLSPELLVELLSTEKGRADAAADLVLQIVSRMTDNTVGEFVANGVINNGGATTRLAHAFQALVPEKDRRPGLLEIARTEVARSPLGSESDFSDLWKNASDLLTSYSDDKFVPEDYARELTGARAQALEVERVSDDPPDRISRWLNSVEPPEVRNLDLQLLLDILTLEPDPELWKRMTVPAVSQIEDLLLVGDFDAAQHLIATLSAEANPERTHSAAASAALGSLAQGSMMTHLTIHLRTADEHAAKQIQGICTAVGPILVKALAEALAVEKRTASRQHLTQILLGFGPVGSQYVEKLKASANPAVRRTAVHLLREFGGSEALPDLTALLDDAEPQIQREAVRAILMIGTDEAYAVLERALASGTNQGREALMAAVVAMRNDRAVPLFEYILRNVDWKGPLRGVYLRAVESLGVLKSDQSVGLLSEALQHGEWWAPRRTAAFRKTVAGALAQIGTPNAIEALDNAARNGPRGVRAAARAVRH